MRQPRFLLFVILLQKHQKLCEALLPDNEPEEREAARARHHGGAGHDRRNAAAVSAGCCRMAQSRWPVPALGRPCSPASCSARATVWVLLLEKPLYRNIVISPCKVPSWAGCGLPFPVWAGGGILYLPFSWDKKPPGQLLGPHRGLFSYASFQNIETLFL